MQWEWEDGVEWFPFSDADSIALDSAYVQGLPFEYLRSPGTSVTFDRVDAIQENPSTGVRRPARRVSSTLWEARLAPQEWVAYNDSISQEIEDAFIARRGYVTVRFAVHENSHPQEYVLHFGPGDGISETRGDMQRVRRTDQVASTDVASNEQCSLPPGMEITLSRSCRPVEALSEHCSICLDQETSEEAKGVELVTCNHAFHEKCIRSAFVNKPECPLCKTAYAVITGNMPTNGSMDVQVLPRDEISLGGFEDVGTILIRYDFPGGTQGPAHPNPGSPYTGTVRTAFLPVNAEGREALRLLQVAWDRRLTFTIGRSLTTGRENTVIWNGIHHKTCPDGGTAVFGWPDAGYFSRLKGELASLGIV
jgi:deltex